VRILVAAPPKTGNVWLEKLLSLAFGLTWVREAPAHDYWGARDPGGLRSFIEAGRFPDHAICHQHFWPSAKLDEILREHDARLATTVRDPYDQFVSWYFYIQNFADAFVAAADPGVRAIGKPVTHPDVLDLLTNEFGTFLDQGIAWLESHRSFIVRYEELHHDPDAVVARAHTHFGLELVMPVQAAITGSSADALRREGADLQRHVRSGRVGDWREHLTSAHLDVFRRSHRSRIERLGYTVW
jgi:hypothetical protein